MLTLADFLQNMDRDERRVFNTVVEKFDGETFTTTKVAVAIGEPVDERGNGREWISRFLEKFVTVFLNVESFERYTDARKGTPHPGYSGPLAVMANGYAKHRPYMLMVPKYVIRAAIQQLGVLPEMQEIDAELEAIRAREAELRLRREKLKARAVR